MHKIKERTYEYVTTISIPGVPAIFTSQSYLSRLFWIIIILGLLSVGAWNIYLAVEDYYNFDVITNIERVSPPQVTFPAITICSVGLSTQIPIITTTTTADPEIGPDPGIGPGPIKQVVFYIHNLISVEMYIKIKDSSDVKTVIISKDTLDFFTMVNDGSCFRFNAALNKSRDLFNAQYEYDQLAVYIRKYNETVSNTIYQWELGNLWLYITDNFLNSFEGIEPLYLEPGYFSHTFKIEKPSIELKLPDPYNQCKEHLLGDEPYHRMNCIETCIYRRIKNKHNCTYPDTLFGVKGFKKCASSTYYKEIKDEVWGSCQEECKLESCYSEKLAYSFKTAELSGEYDYSLLAFSFRDFSSLNITQIPKTDIFTFVNNIGGGFGLFMGLAFPNFVEFIQFMADIFTIVIFT